MFNPKYPLTPVSSMTLFSIATMEGPPIFTFAAKGTLYSSYVVGDYKWLFRRGIDLNLILITSLNTLAIIEIVMKDYYGGEA